MKNQYNPYHKNTRIGVYRKIKSKRIINVKLYELAEQYKNLESYLAEPDIIDEAKFKEQFAQITGEFNVKVEKHLQINFN
jgi:hypothetical protein